MSKPRHARWPGLHPKHGVSRRLKAIFSLLCLIHGKELSSRSIIRTDGGACPQDRPAGPDGTTIPPATAATGLTPPPAPSPRPAPAPRPAPRPPPAPAGPTTFRSPPPAWPVGFLSLRPARTG